MKNTIKYPITKMTEPFKLSEYHFESILNMLIKEITLLYDYSDKFIDLNNLDRDLDIEEIAINEKIDRLEELQRFLKSLEIK